MAIYHKMFRSVVLLFYYIYIYIFYYIFRLFSPDTHQGRNTFSLHNYKTLCACTRMCVVKWRCEKQPVSGHFFYKYRPQMFCRAVVSGLGWQDKTLNGSAIYICTASVFVAWVCQKRLQNFLVVLSPNNLGVWWQKGCVPWRWRWCLRNLVSGRIMSYG